MKNDFHFVVDRNKDGLFQVLLPHKCGEWGISPNTGNVDYEPWSPQADAIVDLKEFIFQAHTALTALENSEKFGERW